MAGFRSVGLAGIALLLGACLQEPTEGWARAQVEALADEIVRHTPEHVHFEEGTRFSWMLLETQEPERIPGLNQAVLGRLRERYTVYLSQEDIPPDRQILAPDGTLQAYRDGFRFKFEVEILAPGRVKVRYEDWEGNLAASGQAITYAWRGSSWEVVEEGPLYVS